MTERTLDQAHGANGGRPPLTEIPLTENARIVLEKRYLRRGEDGKPIETIPEMFWRVASNVAAPDAEYGKDAYATSEAFYELLTSLRFFPNSPTFTGAGTPLGQLAACFTADMRVTTDQGVKRIADLQIGDRVLTHLGRYRPVTELHQRAYNGTLLRIKIKLIGTTLEVTPEHPIMTPAGWVRAGELRVGDKVAIGIPQGVRSVPRFDLAESVYADELEMQVAEAAVRVRRPSAYQNSGRQATWINRFIELTTRYIRNAVTREGEAVYFEVQSIEATDYTGTVYNCEVDEDHSYVTEGVVVHNCFVLPISDDLGRASDGIFQTLRDAALIQQTGGGNGFSFSRLRPKGDIVRSSAGRATGPVGFLRVYDRAFGEVAQGGTRRGANMAVLRVDHPDIEEFIGCKEDENQITNFNISVAITDAFMRAVENDEPFDLINPRDGKVWKTVRARDLFDKIIKHAHHNGEPGALFIDTANRSNPLPHLYQLEATNPCGEQWLGPYENCCLGSINLAQHVTPEGKVDWEKLRETIVLSTRFLDNVVSANKYVPAVPQLKEAALRARRIGLGIMALGDLMYHMGIRYGSEEAQEFAAQVMEFVRYHAMKTSIELAQERGPFPAIQGSIYDPENLKWTPPKPLKPYTHDFGRPPVNWDEIVEGIKQYGIRNAAQTTIAPTGTIATVAGCEAYGCEPVFALAYIRHVNDNGRDLELRYTSPLFEQALIKAGLDEETRRRIVDEVIRKGTCQHITELPEHIRHTFVVSQDITAEEHVYMQAALQAFVDNSISKTINFPATATEKDVADAYFLAWKLGCKGLTVYVTGSREKVVLETLETKEKKEKKEAAAPPAVAPTAPAAPTPPPAEQPAQPLTVVMKPRPRWLPGRTYRVPTPLGTAFITINENGGGQPFEVFMNVGKAGSDTAAVAEALGRLISLVLRLPSPMSAMTRLRQVIDQLSGIGGGRPMGFGAQRVRSLPDGVAQALADYLGDKEGEGEVAPAAVPEAPQPVQLAFEIGDLCPECGQATLVSEEGCRRCYTCGFTEC